MLNGTKSSQKAEDRPISFLLEDNCVAPRTRKFFKFSIRPEDLTKTEPSRMSVHQTLGGAWVDNFGPGVQSINLSGSTGWRGEGGFFYGKDGMEVFKDLNETVFSGWHKKRAAAVKAGKDPDGVRLIFTDTLDGICSIVAPQNFVLRRNKNRPLLMQYQIAMSVISNDVGEIYGKDVSALSTKTIFDIGMSGLDDIVGNLEASSAGMQKLIGETLGKPASQFLTMSSDLLRNVTRISNASDGIYSSLVSVARDVTQGGTNVFRALSIAASIPARAKSRMMEVAGMFWNAYCLIKKMFKGIFRPNYSAFFGASNCSSTAGGSPPSPLRAVNALYGVVAGVGTAVTVANILGSTGSGLSSIVSGGVSKLLDSTGISGLAGSAMSAVTGAIPQLASAATDAVVTAGTAALDGLEKIVNIEPVALLVAGGIDAAVAELPVILSDISVGIHTSLSSIETGVSNKFSGSLSYEVAV